MPRKKAIDISAPPKRPIEESVASNPEGYTGVALPPRKQRPRTSAGLESLRLRASRAASSSKQVVSLSLKVTVELYKALVELAEEYHQPVSVIAKQCLQDGTRKYKEVSGVYENPFTKITPLRAAPQYTQAPARRSVIDKVAERAAASRAFQPELSWGPEPDEEELSIPTDLEDKINQWPAGVFVPSAPVLKGEE